MNISDAIKMRASTRAFTGHAISKNIIKQILDTARWAPSGTNTQPWSVAVVSGKTKTQLCEKLIAAFRSGENANPDYDYYPTTKLSEPYRLRRFACGMALYRALGIKREDKQKRKCAWEKNYVAFDAPVILFFFIDKELEKGSWLDYGMFLQNVMLTALEYDLATCPQAALAEYPDIVRGGLGEIFADKALICGIALGYPDKQAAVNHYRTERESVDNFSQWYF